MGTQSGAASDSTTNEYVDVDTIITELFPYEQPYPDQRDGIKSTIQNFRNGGVSVIEGECGTGKTLISLIAALGVIRDPTTDYEQALVITSVKQQQSAFEEDIEAINQGIIDRHGFARDAPAMFQPVTGLSLVGKGDLCVYTDSGAIPHDNISPRCSTLISNTTDEASKGSIASQTSKADGARDIVAAAQSRVRDMDTDPAAEHDNISNPEHPPEPLTFNGCATCPYYAQHIIDDEDDNDTLQFNWEMFDAATLREKASQLGTCPYMAMHNGLDKAEVIIGNYAHVFHDTTVEAVTQSVIGANTLLIVDEAHMLPEKVRDYESVTVSRDALIEAVDEIQHMQSELSALSGEMKDRVEDAFRRYDTNQTQVTEFKSLISELRQMVERVVGSHVEAGNDTYEENIGFRDPEELEDDRFDKWLEHINFDEELIENAEFCGKAISKALRVIAHATDSDVKADVKAERVGELLTKKHYAGNAEYFCEIVCEGRGSYSEWEYDYNSELHENYRIDVALHNCMPSREIQRRLMKFGGGLLMSATISPMDVYTSISGVDDVPKPTVEKEFPLRFPEENRESVIVPLTKFTDGNRGDRSRSNETRAVYKNALVDVIRNAKGNTLVCMPSYGEAKWVEDVVGDEIPNPVYVDESSTNDETMALKKAFETQDNGVLVTSLRGTLTEGVDYSGDKLSNVVVVGVPLTYPYSNRAQAIQTAYAVEFGRRNAFDYSHSVPAVYKTRQAIGRVIRGDDEVGTRVLIDERYTADHHQSVFEYLSSQQQDEFDVVEAERVGDVIAEFWNERDV